MAITRSYVIFNEDGSISTLKVASSINQGSNNVNEIFAAIKGISPSNYSCAVEFELPNGDLEELSGIRENVFLDNRQYNGYLVSLAETVTRLAGNLKVNLKLIDLQGNVICTYQVTLKVNTTGYEPNETNITEAQYNSLLQSLNSYALKGDVIGAITLDGTETLAYLLDTYGASFFGVYNGVYGFGIVNLYGTTYQFEIESLTSKRRWFGEVVGTTTVADIIDEDTYRQDYVTENEVVLFETLDGNESLGDLIEQYGAPLVLNFKYNSVPYVIGIKETTEGYCAFELECLTNKNRWVSANIDTHTLISNLMDNAYADNYVTSGEVIKKVTLDFATTTLQDLIDTYGDSLTLNIIPSGGGTAPIYSIGVQYTHTGYCDFEIESVVGKTRFAGTSVATSTVLNTIIAGTTYRADYQIASEGIPYLTTEPSQANTDGLKIVVLNSEPSTKYSGYLYLITE